MNDFSLSMMNRYSLGPDVEISKVVWLVACREVVSLVVEFLVVELLVVEFQYQAKSLPML